MKVLIVGGFLGSGKTSLVEEIARYIAGRRKNPECIEVVIIENEIGDISIDEPFLKTTGVEIKNLFAGCACCTLSGEAADLLNMLKKDLNPQWVILELSGAALPVNITQMTEKLQIETHICVLVDASRWERIHIPLGKLLRDQLEMADIVLLNKIDLLKEEDIEVIGQSIKNKNQYMRIKQSSLLRTLEEGLIKEILGEGDGNEDAEESFTDA